MSTADEKDIDPTTVESAKAIVDELAKGNKTLIQQLIDIGYDIDGYFKDYFTNLLGISDSDDATSIINKMIAYLNEASDSDKTSFYSIFDAVGSSIFGDNWDNINKVISDLKSAQTENVATGSMEKSAPEQPITESKQSSEIISEQETFTSNLKDANAELEQLNQKMQSEFGLGNVDLTKRPKVDSAKMQEAGYDVEDGSTSTVFSSTDFIWQGDWIDMMYDVNRFQTKIPEKEDLELIINKYFILISKINEYLEKKYGE